MKKSVWQDEVAFPKFRQVKEDIKTDVLIIGGGICGILCAHFLNQKGIDYVLAEGSTICSGTTKNTTAKITSQHGLIYDKLISSIGADGAKKYFFANQDAIAEYEKLCKSIDCDFEKKKAYTYSLTDRFIIEKEVNAVNSLGFSANFEENTELPFKTKGAICFAGQAQFNPLKFIKEISKDLNIYEHSFINEIGPCYAKSNGHKITFKKAIICTHFPFINKHGSYFLKLYQHRSYVSAFENAGNINGMYVDEDQKGLSFRQYNGLLLLGGGSHRTGKDGGSWQELDRMAKRYYPEADLKYQWSTQDCMSLDHIPYIGQYSAKTPDLLVATGFNKWGITSSMVAAKILSDMVLDKTPDYADVFSPQRSILKPQLLVNGFESTVHLLKPTAPRCPHLG
ncbi:MAG: FAD-binding oxidoreductase, partial [Clostridia bacterium]|nr:FAD-binding oxidoreductase [Clostridia bacterium]